MSLFNKEGAGKTGCRLAPAAPRALGSGRKKHRRKTTGVAGSSDLPCAMVYGLYALFPGTLGVVDPVAPDDRCFKARLGSTPFVRSLTPTLGRQNHTTSPSATLPLVLHARPLTGFPALRPHAHTAASRPPHPAPRFATTGRNAPLTEQDGRTILLIYRSRNRTSRDRITRRAIVA